ncbi:MAG: fumarate reductase cytochrome b subunit, partial [Pseudomonadales bacterium]
MPILKNNNAHSRAINRWPAWLDIAQGVTGLVLVLFMWAHMLLVSSILLGKDAMYFVARLFEGQYLFGRPYPLLVSFIAAAVFLIFVVHALVAIRHMPNSYREYHTFWRHSRSLRHPDTTLWLIQVFTGLLLMFFASVHLYAMFTHPGDIGPYASSDRVVTGVMWPLYLVLLFAVELHAGIGTYRLALKWGWPSGKDPRHTRRILSRAKWLISVFFIVLGLLT